MTLIKSISGIRGTIGGLQGENLTPEDAVLFTAAYGTWLKEENKGAKCKVVIGRDARVSGDMMAKLVSATFMGLGIDVIDLGLSTTPTVEVAVPGENAQGGIILTASHNPFQWNALKLLNSKGEFISGDQGGRIVQLAEEGNIDYAEADQLGKELPAHDWMERHVDQILDLSFLDLDAIKKRNFTVVVDAVNSTGGIFVPYLLKRLGVENIIEIHCEPNGHFPHNPEPLKENLVDLADAVRNHKADLGIAVDPDVDRLVFMSENGELFGEEYTLVAVSDYVLSKKKGNTVSNLSSTRALMDVTRNHGGEYFASAVGEVNVVEKMKEVSAVIGGEGNGGVILPELHYGRDALVGIALFLSHLSTWEGGNRNMSELKAKYPEYFMSKNKMSLENGMDVSSVLDRVSDLYQGEEMNDIDGLKIDFANEWVHLRKSNTEPIIRIYTESGSQQSAEELANSVIKKIESVL